jgi:tRNA(fMet)-specific endonuclease VapC
VRYLVDTNTCIAWLKRNARVRQKWLAAGADEVVLSTIVRAELLFGARRSSRVAENLATLDELFSAMQSLDFDDSAAAHYGTLRASLAIAGAPIGSNDMLIAASALAHDLTLVTRNEREFRRVPGLRVASW